MGCGSGGDSGDTPAQGPYVGNWHHASSDVYLEIQTDNTVVVRTCSANGYKAQGTGTIQGDSLTLSSTTFNLLRNGDALTLVDPDGLKVELALTGAIPAVCSNDFIEITSVNPTTGTANVLTLFTVNFDYRLATKDNGIIYLGFNIPSDPDAFALTSSTLAVTRGAGSSSLTASGLPVEYPSPGSFAAYVNLSENPHPDAWTPLSYRTVPIVVVQASSMSSALVANGAANKRQGSSISGRSCGSGVIGSCAMPLP